MVKEVDGSSAQTVPNPTHIKWILEAIRKVKRQKQRPCVERITAAVRQFHNLNDSTIAAQLDVAVKEGSVVKLFNKGLCSYKDPSRLSQLKTRTLKLSRKSDLTKVITKCIKELGNSSGSSLKAIEKHVRRSYSLEFINGAEVDIARQIRVSVKRALNTGFLKKDGRLYKLGPNSGVNSVGNGVQNGVHLPFSADESLVLVDKAALRKVC
ncbi:hypothetical protein NP493_454g02017 [Ridgeia piscesae]|uniref:Histone acetyltransferase n=1 Tax=Ridgeia piscesae TaxID=27915 RepID=A0AAD9NRK1_RIDPI|nr:hypothetical protein NP493_454g02017 [Ridgeia piscesae]